MSAFCSTLFSRNRDTEQALLGSPIFMKLGIKCSFNRRTVLPRPARELGAGGRQGELEGGPGWGTPACPAPPEQSVHPAEQALGQEAGVRALHPEGSPEHKLQ